MSECLLCGGEGALPDRKVHFGDGVDEEKPCPACRGAGEVEVSPTGGRAITIIKPHGVWGESQSGES